MTIARHDIKSMDDYLRNYGPMLGKKAIESLNPLHRPNRDELLDFSDITEFNPDRTPLEAQKHAITAATKMLDAVGDGFLVGEMGTGKTIMGMLTIHKHAKGKPYRAMVLCPDHLIAVWEEEIRTTIPGAVIHQFENWKGVTKLLGQGIPVKKGNRTFLRYPKPIAPTWILLGRNQAKYMPEFVGVGEKRRGFDGNEREGRCVSQQMIGRVDKTDEEGKVVLDQYRQKVTVPLVQAVVQCPTCGTIARGVKETMLEPKDLGKKQWTCEGNYLVGGVRADQRRSHGKDRLRGGLGYKHQVGRTTMVDGRPYTVVACNEPLWNYTKKPYRFPPASIFQRKLKSYCKYLVIDEVHEQKSDESAQSMAAGKLMSCVDHVLALTGTLIGGYANHLFPLLVRMAARTVRAEGFEWAKDLAWSQAYGRIDRIVTTKQDVGEVSVGRRQTTMRRARTGKSTERLAVRPGIMPTMYGRHLMGNSVFIQLAEMDDELPLLEEFVAEGACDMDEDQATEYRRVETILESANRALLQNGSMKLLGATLWTLMDYPDHPYGWKPEHEGRHSVGYYIKPGDKTEKNWQGVVTPADLEDRIRPKERKLIDICKAEKRDGKQTWVYVQCTGKRNIQPRLKKLLEAEGLKVTVLRSGDVNPKQRKEWIDKNGPLYDVIISNPKLVETGLTLFSRKPGGHNFSTLVFYETGYNLFTLRQAARRAWRIGQPHDCKVYYLYYRDTMQHRAMDLMSRKLSSAAALEGEFSTEGLIGMADEDNAQIALARTLSKQIGEGADMQRAWSKGSGKSGTKKPRRTPSLEILTPRPFVPDALDKLPDEIQLAAMTTIDVLSVPVVIPDIRIEDFGSAIPQVQVGPGVEAEPAVTPQTPIAFTLDRETLAKMYANMEANGFNLDDLLN